jgi:hypothetical protein
MRLKLRLLNLILTVVLIFIFTACTSAKTSAETTSETAILDKTAAATAAESAVTETSISETTAAETTLPEKTAESTKGKTIYKVGDRGPAGGFIICVNPSVETAEGDYLEAIYLNSSSDPGWEDPGWEYLEAAPYDQYDLVDQPDLIPWQPYDTWPGVATGATSTAIGTGMANTKKIINIWGEDNYAAKICYDLTINGYNDWALPSKDELSLMFTVLAKVDEGGFEADTYWSSTEDTDIRCAWAQYFADGLQYNTSWKYYPSCVRAVRVGMLLGTLEEKSFD